MTCDLDLQCPIAAKVLRWGDAEGGGVPVADFIVGADCLFFEKCHEQVRAMARDVSFVTIVSALVHGGTWSQGRRRLLDARPSGDVFTV